MLIHVNSILDSGFNLGNLSHVGWFKRIVTKMVYWCCVSYIYYSCGVIIRAVWRAPRRQCGRAETRVLLYQSM